MSWIERIGSQGEEVSDEELRGGGLVCSFDVD